MIIKILMITLGFILLIAGANLLIKGSSKIAQKFKIPELLIGLTIVALGTSAPELIITITSANKQASDLIIGNVIGSNLCNLLLILGVMSIISPIKVDNKTKKIHIPTLFLSTLLILIMQMGVFNGSYNIINKVDGIILVALFLIYFSYPIIIETKDIIKTHNNKNIEKNENVLLAILYIFIGFILLKYGGDFVVDYSIKISKIFNLSEGVIGLTIIAIGTALPELATSIIAVINKDTDLAVGNIVGSCILNTFLILGTGAILTPLVFSKEFLQNTIILAISILLIWLFCILGKKNTITKTKGLILLIIFVLFIIRV